MQTLVVLPKLFFPPAMVFPRPAGVCSAGAKPAAHPRAALRWRSRRGAGRRRELLQERLPVPVLGVAWPGPRIAACQGGRFPLTVSYVTGAFRARSRRLPAASGWLEQDFGGRGPRPQAGYLPAPAFAHLSAGQALSQSRSGAAGTWRASRPPLPRPWGKGGACPHAPGAARPSVPWRGP